MKYLDVLGKDFKRKKDAYKHFRSLRDQTPLGKILDEKTAITKNAMDKLFKDYFLCNDEDWYERKIGPGVSNWSFGYDSQGGICLWVHQKDPHELTDCQECKEKGWCWSCGMGEKIPVAARWMFTCFGTGVLMNGDKMHRVKQAARKAVEIHKKQFREQVKSNCNECGVEVHGLNAEVDHKNPTFITLFNNFVKENNYDEEYLLKSVNKHSHEDIWYFINTGMKESWIEYHLHNCHLQLLCVPCHKNKTYGRKKCVI